jgi:hypothetical protein
MLPTFFNESGGDMTITPKPQDKSKGKNKVTSQPLPQKKYNNK